MKHLKTWTLLTVVCWAGVAGAQLQLLPDNEPQQVFSGKDRKITMVWHNAGKESADAEMVARIFQTSSTTAVQIKKVSWKRLQVLPQQTVIESAELDFPAVKAETKFLVQWLENTNQVIGKTEVLVYPTNLLVQLKPLSGDQALGVFDPQNILKPLLKNLKLDFTDLENSDLDNFSGKLAIVGPFQSKMQMRDGLANQIHALAKKHSATIWIQPPPRPEDKIKPSFYFVPVGTNVVVVVQPGLVADLVKNPQSQLNLLYFCQLALNRQPPALPDLFPQP